MRYSAGIHRPNKYRRWRNFDFPRRKNRPHARPACLSHHLREPHQPLTFPSFPSLVSSSPPQSFFSPSAYCNSVLFLVNLLFPPIPSQWAASRTEPSLRARSSSPRSRLERAMLTRLRECEESCIVAGVQVVANTPQATRCRTLFSMPV